MSSTKVTVTILIVRLAMIRLQFIFELQTPFRIGSQCVVNLLCTLFAGTT